MNIFLRPTILKVVITLILLAVVFSGTFLYSTTLTFTENGFYQSNLFLKIVNAIAGIIYFPIHLILSLIPNMDMITYQSHPLALLFVAIISLLLTITESYLVSCVVSAFINKSYGKDF